MDSRKVGATVTAGCVGVMALGVHDAEDAAQRANLERVVEWLTAIDQPFITPDDIRHQLWGKLICNVGVNQACAVYDCCFSGIHAPGEAREAMIAAMREVAAVGRAEGVGLTEEDVVYWLDIIDHLNPEGLPSLRQDVLARRPTEVELFSGTINRLGALRHPHAAKRALLRRHQGARKLLLVGANLGSPRQALISPERATKVAPWLGLQALPSSPSSYVLVTACFQ